MLPALQPYKINYPTMRNDFARNVAEACLVYGVRNIGSVLATIAVDWIESSTYRDYAPLFILPQHLELLPSRNPNNVRPLYQLPALIYALTESISAKLPQQTRVFKERFSFIEGETVVPAIQEDVERFHALADVSSSCFVSMELSPFDDHMTCVRNSYSSVYNPVSPDQIS